MVVSTKDIVYYSGEYQGHSILQSGEYQGHSILQSGEYQGQFFTEW